MSISILTNYNFNQNQIISAVIGHEPNLSVLNPVKGQVAFDSTANKMYYYNGSTWHVMDGSNALSYLANGNGIISLINNAGTTGRINNDRLANSSITIGSTNISLGGTATNITGATYNNVGITGSATVGERSINVSNASLVVGTVGKTGTITLTSNSLDPRTLTLNSSITVDGSGTSSATFYKNLTIGSSTLANGKNITIKTDDAATTDIIATFPNVASMTLVGTSISQALTNKTYEGLTITSTTGTLTISNAKTLSITDTTTIANNKITFANTKSITNYVNTTFGASSTYTGDITIRSNNSGARTLTLENTNLTLAGTGTKLTINNSPTIAGTGTITLTGSLTVDSGATASIAGTGKITLTNSATFVSPFTVGTATTNTGSVKIQSNNAESRVLTLTNPNLELKGSTGSSLTINNSPTIAGTGSITLGGVMSNQGTDYNSWFIGPAVGTRIYLKSVYNAGSDELEIRNTADNGFANLRVKDLYVEGTTTTINSETVTIADNVIVLNGDITNHLTNAATSGIEVKRFNEADTAQPVQLVFDEINGNWATDSVNSISGAVIRRPIANKYSATFGDGVAKVFTITHNLDTIDAVVLIRETAGDKAMVIADVEFVSNNSIEITTSNVPTVNQYTATIIG
jgi:hypothetical protein